jgi:hypothetical protein
MQWARLMNAEWENGTHLLKGEVRKDMAGVTRQFPDQDGRFHWDDVLEDRKQCCATSI